MPEGIRRLLLHGVDDNLAFGSDFCELRSQNKSKLSWLKRLSERPWQTLDFFDPTQQNRKLMLS